MSSTKSKTLILCLLLLHTHAIVFTIQNNCPYTLWPAGQTWTLNFPKGPNLAKIWACTNCTFDASGRGRCLTGDCNGQLQCKTPSPSTVSTRSDEYVISVLEGFNVPIEFRPTTNGCTTRPVRCAGDLIGSCPAQLKAPGGCHNPCKSRSFLRAGAG